MAVTNYIWDMVNDNVLAETDESDEVTVEYTCEPDQFGNLISQERNGVESFYQFDGQGSTRALTCENGDVTDSYTYTAFGEEVSKTGTTENPYRYVGEKGYYRDGETGDCYVRARSYEPRIARWLSIDSLYFVDGPNLYSFSRGNPANYSDPSGNLCMRDLEKGFHVEHCPNIFSAYQWPIEWDIGKERFGYIIQKVSNIDIIWDCAKTEYSITQGCGKNDVKLKWPKGGALAEPIMTVYWELWVVKGGVIHIGKPAGMPGKKGGKPDKLAGPVDSDKFQIGPTKGTCGFHYQKGEAFFYKTPGPAEKFPPPGGWAIWNVRQNLPSGSLAMTCSQDVGAEQRFTGGRFPVVRSVIGSWCCCKCNEFHHFFKLQATGKC